MSEVGVAESKSLCIVCLWVSTAASTCCQRAHVRTTSMQI